MVEGKKVQTCDHFQDDPQFEKKIFLGLNFSEFSTMSEYYNTHTRNFFIELCISICHQNVEGSENAFQDNQNQFLNYTSAFV